MAGASCSLQACPASLAGLLAGEVPGSCILLPLLLKVPEHAAPQHFLPFLKATCILSGTDHKYVTILSPLDSSFFTAHLLLLSTL